MEVQEMQEVARYLKGFSKGLDEILTKSNTEKRIHMIHSFLHFEEKHNEFFGNEEDAPQWNNVRKTFKKEIEKMNITREEVDKQLRSLAKELNIKDIFLWNNVPYNYAAIIRHIHSVKHAIQGVKEDSRNHLKDMRIVFNPRYPYYAPVKRGLVTTMFGDHVIATYYNGSVKNIQQDITNGLQSKKGVDRISLLGKQFGIKGVTFWYNVSYDYQDLSKNINKISNALSNLTSKEKEELQDIKIILNSKNSDPTGFVKSNEGDYFIAINYAKNAEEIRQDITNGLERQQEEQKKQVEEKLSQIAMQNFGVSNTFLWSNESYDYRDILKHISILEKVFQELGQNDKYTRYLRKTRIFLNPQGFDGFILPEGPSMTSRDTYVIAIDYNESAENIKQDVKDGLKRIQVEEKLSQMASELEVGKIYLWNNRIYDANKVEEYIPTIKQALLRARKILRNKLKKLEKKINEQKKKIQSIKKKKESQVSKNYEIQRLEKEIQSIEKEKILTREQLQNLSKTDIFLNQQWVSTLKQGFSLFSSQEGGVITKEGNYAIAIDYDETAEGIANDILQGLTLEGRLSAIATYFDIKGIFLFPYESCSYEDAWEHLSKINNALKTLSPDQKKVLADTKIFLEPRESSQKGFIKTKSGEFVIALDYKNTEEEIKRNIKEGLVKKALSDMSKEYGIKEIFLWNGKKYNYEELEMQHIPKIRKVFLALSSRNKKDLKKIKIVLEPKGSTQKGLIQMGSGRKILALNINENEEEIKQNIESGLKEWRNNKGR
jgi:hypothetical protein